MCGFWCMEVGWIDGPTTCAGVPRYCLRNSRFVDADFALDNEDVLEECFLDGFTRVLIRGKAEEVGTI